MLIIKRNNGVVDRLDSNIIFKKILQKYTMCEKSFTNPV